MNPFIHWRAHVLNDTELSTNAKFVLLVLSTYANDWNDMAWPSHATIAGQMSCSVSTVKRAIDECVKQGWLLKDSRYRNDTGAMTSNAYTFQIPEKLSTDPSSHRPGGQVTQSYPPSSHRATNKTNKNMSNEYKAGHKNGQKVKSQKPSLQARGEKVGVPAKPGWTYEEWERRIVEAERRQ